MRSFAFHFHIFFLFLAFRNEPFVVDASLRTHSSSHEDLDRHTHGGHHDEGKGLHKMDMKRMVRA